MCFERHATSKIKTTDDLFNILTMGFRGEALASIAAVAQVELKTKLATEDIGTYIKIEGSKVIDYSQCQCAKGTSIIVKNLFFNVPARRNFLKADSVEFNHCYEEFVRIALAYPEKAFHFTHKDGIVFALHKTSLAERVVDVLGAHYKNKLAACKEETIDIKISGYIGKPELAKKKRGEQFLFVNKRFIKSPYIHHAICEAYGNTLEQGLNPMYCIFIEIPPIHIDINVHPTKTEIKFDDEKTIYNIVKSAVRKSISLFNLSVNIDFESNINDEFFRSLNFLDQYKNSDSNSSNTTTFSSKINYQDWNALYEGFKKDTVKQEEASPSLELRFGSKINEIEVENQQSENQNLCFQLYNAYIVTMFKNTLIVIDQQAAHERILFDKFSYLYAQKGVEIQKFLFPVEISLSPSEAEIVNEMLEDIKALGFDIEPYGKCSFMLNGIPSHLKSGQEIEVFKDLIYSFNTEKNQASTTKREIIAKALAKRYAIKKGNMLQREEMLNLVEQLLSSSNPSFTPSGQSIILSLSKEYLEQLI
jgi:DNA mismatch repair protein MutL